MKIYIIAFRDWYLIIDEDTKVFLSKEQAQKYLDKNDKYDEYEMVELEIESEEE